jgi:hypothetical protein
MLCEKSIYEIYVAMAVKYRMLCLAKVNFSDREAVRLPGA